jgi:SNF2 family DNA or RNA helicase
MLRDEFGAELEIGKELWDWAANEVAREKKVTDLLPTAKGDAYKSFEIPTRVGHSSEIMSKALSSRPYQVPGVNYLAGARTAMLADQPGLGKTIQTLGALIEGLDQDRTNSVLVLAPKSAVNSVWADEINHWMGDYTEKYTITSLAGKTPAKIVEAIDDYLFKVAWDPAHIHFLLANAEMVRIKSGRTCPKGECNGMNEFCEFESKHKGQLEPRIPAMFEMQWDAIIADETHKWLINANARSKSVSQVGLGFAKLQLKPGGMKVALSGTPVKGKQHNLFGTVHWLRPDVYTSKWNWVERYFEVTENGYGRDIGKLLPERKEAFFRSLDGLMLRRTKAEIRRINPAWMPPEKIYHDVWVDMDPSQAKAYKSIEERGSALLEGGRLDTHGMLSEMTRWKQLASCAGKMEQVTKMKKATPPSNRMEPVTEMVFTPTMPSAKFDWLLDFLEARGIETRSGRAGSGDLSPEVHKVVVASQFTKSIDLWAAELVGKGIQCYTLTGATTQRKRDEYIKNFQTRDEVRVFFINTLAGGAAITLDAADDIVIMDETWVPDEQEQVEDRVHRASNVTHQVDVWYVRANGTVEEAIAKANFGKAESNHVVLDANRGLAFIHERFGKVATT